MKKTTKSYKGGDVNMLTAASSITKRAIDNKALLAAKRPNWGANYFDDLLVDIQKAFDENVGIDKAKDIRQATIDNNKYCDAVYRYLSELKVQLIEDYKDDNVRMKTILSELGYDSFHKHGKKPGKANLINWAYQFKKNMTNVLTTELVNKGILQSIITDISDMAEKVQITNQTLNNLKVNKPALTQQNQARLNEIYKEVIGIAKIARRIFTGDKALQSLFSYNYSLLQMGVIKKPQQAATEDEAIDTSADVNLINTEI